MKRRVYSGLRPGLQLTHRPANDCPWPTRLELGLSQAKCIMRGTPSYSNYPILKQETLPDDLPQSGRLNDSPSYAKRTARWEPEVSNHVTDKTGDFSSSLQWWDGKAFGDGENRWVSCAESNRGNIKTFHGQTTNKQAPTL